MQRLVFQSGTPAKADEVNQNFSLNGYNPGSAVVACPEGSQIISGGGIVLTALVGRQQPGLCVSRIAWMRLRIKGVSQPLLTQPSCRLDFGAGLYTPQTVCHALHLMS